MRIKAAAIKWGGKVYTLDPPARHHDIMRKYNILGMGDCQGFITEDDMFLNREDAMTFARDAGQIQKTYHMIKGVKVSKSINDKRLFSEDLW